MEELVEIEYNHLLLRGSDDNFNRNQRNTNEITSHRESNLNSNNQFNRGLQKNTNNNNEETSQMMENTADTTVEQLNENTAVEKLDDIRVNKFPFLDPPTAQVSISEPAWQMFDVNHDNYLEEMNTVEQQKEDINIPLPLTFDIPGGIYKAVLWFVGDNSVVTDPRKRMAIFQLLAHDDHPLLFGSIDELNRFNNIDVSTVLFEAFRHKEHNKALSLLDLFIHHNDFKFLNVAALSEFLNVASLSDGQHSQLYWLLLYTKCNQDLLSKSLISSVITETQNLPRTSHNEIDVTRINPSIYQEDIDEFVNRLIQHDIPISFIFVAHMNYIGTNIKPCMDFEKQFQELLPRLITVVSIVKPSTNNSVFYTCRVKSKKQNQFVPPESKVVYIKNSWSIEEDFEFQLPIDFLSKYAPQLLTDIFQRYELLRLVQGRETNNTGNSMLIINTDKSCPTTDTITKSSQNTNSKTISSRKRVKVGVV